MHRRDRVDEHAADPLSPFRWRRTTRAAGACSRRSRLIVRNRSLARIARVGKALRPRHCQLKTIERRIGCYRAAEVMADQTESSRSSHSRTDWDHRQPVILEDACEAAPPYDRWPLQPQPWPSSAAVPLAVRLLERTSECRTPARRAPERKRLHRARARTARPPPERRPNDENSRKVQNVRGDGSAAYLV
jgi:hypothetical protein